MDLLGIIFSIAVIVYGLFAFITVKKYCKKIEKNKDAIENDAHLQRELDNDSKKIVVIINVMIVLIVLLTVTNLILILFGA